MSIERKTKESANMLLQVDNSSDLREILSIKGGTYSATGVEGIWNHLTSTDTVLTAMQIVDYVKEYDRDEILEILEENGFREEYEQDYEQPFEDMPHTELMNYYESLNYGILYVYDDAYLVFE